jgi:hypothetical protein
MWNRSPGLNITEDWFSTAQYFDVKTRHSGVADVGIAIGSYMTLSGDGPDPERIGVIRLSSNLLTMMGATMERGRVLGSSDDVPGSPNVALLHYGTWIRRYGGDPNVIGRTLQLNGQPFEIAGVLSRAFSLPREVLPTLGVVEDADVIVPLRLGAQAATARDHETTNRRAAQTGVTFAAAQQEMDRPTRACARTSASVSADGWPDVQPRPDSGPWPVAFVAALILSVAVAAVLLIACVNVPTCCCRGRRPAADRAARAALGAGRGRLIVSSLKACCSPARRCGGDSAAWAGVGYGYARFVRPMCRWPRRLRSTAACWCSPRADACGRRALRSRTCAQFVARRPARVGGCSRRIGTRHV